MVEPYHKLPVLSLSYTNGKSILLPKSGTKKIPGLLTKKKKNSYRKKCDILFPSDIR